VSDFSEREPHTFFGYVTALNIDERNELDEYLRGLPEFNEWDEAGFLLGLTQKLLKASTRSGATADAVEGACEQLRADFRKYKDLEDNLRRKVKAWCRAMVEV